MPASVFQPNTYHTSSSGSTELIPPDIETRAVRDSDWPSAKPSFTPTAVTSISRAPSVKEPLSSFICHARGLVEGETFSNGLRRAATWHRRRERTVPREPFTEGSSVSDWMTCAGHKSNILSDKYTYLGVAQGKK